MSDYEELYRDDYLIISTHSRSQVAIQTGLEPDNESPTIAKTQDVIDALEAHLNGDEADD